MSIPIGALAMYTQELAPSSWDEGQWWICDGSPQQRYTETGGDVETPLFAVFGSTFGDGDKVTTYQLPDLRGVFVRGADSSPAEGPAGIDPGPRDDSSVADAIGSYEADCVGLHTHSMSGTWGSMVNDEAQQPVRGTSAGTAPAPTSNSQTGLAGGSETRPANCALTFLALADQAPDSPPAGVMMYWGGLSDPDPTATMPDIWLICDGRVVTLPDGSLFPLPDLRGRFLRAAPADTSNVGSAFFDSITQHMHPLCGSCGILHDGGGSTQAMGAPGDGDPGGDTDSSGLGMGLESRPKNIYLHHIMRVC